MLSKRDKLLVRPWQQKKYENHRRKVQSALPIIDNKPPASREHVLNKLKKHQKEVERCTKIERDNLTLLRKLSHTMRTSRVDNYWSTPQPNFLNRVPLYGYYPSRDNIIIIEESVASGPSSRKSRCVACTPKKIIDVLVPEERIPWEPEKPPVSRLRSKSVPNRRPQLMSGIERNIPKTAEARVSSGASYSKSKMPDTKTKAASAKRKDQASPSKSGEIPPSVYQDIYNYFSKKELANIVNVWTWSC